jgi:signal transduction histidine kinase
MQRKTPSKSRTQRLGFTVDTSLFRELGEMLVGRDSTALAELIKNAYDADAEHVSVHGAMLSEKNRGYIKIVDDGTGMTLDQFKKGFLRIASRHKQRTQRWTTRYKRRVTGEKGIGRLAAHKLAEVMEIESIARPNDDNLTSLKATIDWGAIEQRETLEDAKQAVNVSVRRLRRGTPGTTITLRKLRRTWTDTRRQSFVRELDSFHPPEVLYTPIPKRILRTPALNETIEVRDENLASRFAIELTGDFDIGEEFWRTVLSEASWLIEIDARDDTAVAVRISPTQRLRQDEEIAKYLPSSPYDFRIQRRFPSGPAFQSRIFYRSGVSEIGRAAPFGVRIYMEGFRVLPYGEERNDWLGLNADYVRRMRGDDLDKEAIEGLDELAMKANQLFAASQRQYFGAVFLTEERSKGLEMLINREGFIPDESFESIVKIMRQSIQLSVRVRAALDARARPAPSSGSSSSMRRSIEGQIKSAESAARRAEREISNTKAVQARTATTLIEATHHLISFANGMISRAGQLEIVAAIGTLTAGVVHEFSALVGMARGLEDRSEILASLLEGREARRALTALRRAINDLRQSIERQASYLTDLVGVDARRNRSRQDIRKRLEAAIRIYRNAIEARDIEIINEIPEGLKTPVAMFPAELITVFTNLLSNAIKAAGDRGKIRITAASERTGSTTIVVSNTGSRVDLEEAERWFVPFESTTSEIDPELGQGMGLGLTIVRNVLADLDATVNFVKPKRAYATAVEITFSK